MPCQKLHILWSFTLVGYCSCLKGIVHTEFYHHFLTLMSFFPMKYQRRGAKRDCRSFNTLKTVFVLFDCQRHFTL